MQFDSLEAISRYLALEFDLDASDISEMLVEYLGNLSRLIGDAKAASGSPDRLHKVGHAIKGAAANVSSQSISALGRKLEDVAKDGARKDAVESVISELQLQYDELKAQHEAMR